MGNRHDTRSFANGTGTHTTETQDITDTYIRRFLCSVVCVGMYFIGIVLRLENVFSAQYFIPIFGILMGNMLSSNVIALNTYYSGLKREQQLYRYLLGNGLPVQKRKRRLSVRPLSSIQSAHRQYLCHGLGSISRNNDWTDIGRE